MHSLIPLSEEALKVLRFEQLAVVFRDFNSTYYYYPYAILRFLFNRRRPYGNPRKAF
jgi:hypothetical protein